MSKKILPNQEDNAPEVSKAHFGLGASEQLALEVLAGAMLSRQLSSAGWPIWHKPVVLPRPSCRAAATAMTSGPKPLTRSARQVAALGGADPACTGPSSAAATGATVCCSRTSWLLAPSLDSSAASSCSVRRNAACCCAEGSCEANMGCSWAASVCPSCVRY